MKMKKLLIRAEDKNRWGAPRTRSCRPTLAEILQATGAQALVEKSDKRFFSADQYAAAGAVDCEGMAEGDVISRGQRDPPSKSS